MKGSWYILEGSRAKDFINLLHIPYTTMVFAYVIIGAMWAPTFYVDRLIWILAAYFLGLGCAAHFLDETRGHPWGTKIPDSVLYALSAFTLSAAVAIGLYYAWKVSYWLLFFIATESFFALAYNLEWFKGRFHTDLWFSISWGALPFLTSYFINAVTITLESLVMAAVLSGTAAIEITLSRWIKTFRRGKDVEGLVLSDGTKLHVSTLELIASPQRALKLIVCTTDFLALAMVIRFWVFR